MIIPQIITHYSLQRGFIKPDEAAAQCKRLGYSHCILADDNLSGVIDFFTAMKKEGITPIIGLTNEDGLYIAKTLTGYKTLLRLASGESPQCESIDLEFFEDADLSTFSVYYSEKEDAVLHRIMVCSKHKTNFRKVETGTTDLKEDALFFKTDEFYFKDISPKLFTDIQLKRTEKLVSELHEYSILAKPKLPKVDTQGMTEDERLIYLCREGYKEKLSHLAGQKRLEYGERAKYELDIITKFGLSGYFLIVHDIIDYVRKNGWLPGPGRGSCGGSLVAFLLNITRIDPIPYNLMFSRFLNSGRFSEGNISLPDIDMDVPSFCRDNIIEYIKNKYGHDKVCQMITLGKLKGRSAFSEVATRYGDLMFAEVKEITEGLPPEAGIADELEEMEVSSVILWALEHTPKRLDKWCKLVDGKIVGELAELFELAIRLEGTYKSRGTHPAGVIISNEPIINDAPMTTNKDGMPVAGFEMSVLDKVGLVKFDVLGVNLLDKIMRMTEK